MDASFWIAFAALIFTILTVSGGGLAALFNRMESNNRDIVEQISALKSNLDSETEAIRTAAFVEYRELRREMNDGWGKAYLEFGEAPKALREKLSQVELFMRDEFVSKREYDKDQKRLFDMLKALGESIEKRLDRIDQRLEKRESANA